MVPLSSSHLNPSQGTSSSIQRCQPQSENEASGEDINIMQVQNSSSPTVEVELLLAAVQVSPRAVCNSTQVNPKTKASKKRKSWAWDYVTESTDANGKRIGICKTCEKSLPADSIHYGTTTIAEHLKRKCKECLPYQGQLKGQPIITQTSMDGPLIPHSFSQKRCEKKLVRFIIQDGMSFRMVEGTCFKQLLFELCPKLKIPNRQKKLLLLFGKCIKWKRQKL